MPQCAYCGESFADDDAYLDHLGEDHRDELGRIDRRRVEDREDNGGPSRSLLVVGAFAILLIVVGGAFLMIGGGGDTDPVPDPSVHVHGTMAVTIEGEELPLSESPEFVENHEIFHFHGYEMDRYGVHLWHVHGRDVTLSWALGTLGIEVDDEGTTLTYDGTTYDDGDPDTTVEILVNGEPVDPGTYELNGVGPEEEAVAGEGDDVAITVVRTV